MQQGNLNFVIEDKTITRAEIRPSPIPIKDSFGKIVKVAKTGIIERRIENRIIAEIQKRTLSIDIQAIETEAEMLVNNKLEELNISEIDKNTYTIAVAEECRKLIKSKVDNKFSFTKRGLLEIAKTSSNNMYHLSDVLENMQSKESRKFEELYVDFSKGKPELRKRDQLASFFPTMGEDYSLTDKEPDEKIIFTVNEDLLPYMVAPNKKSYDNKGYIVIYSDIIDQFEFTHTLSLYKIVTDVEKVWQNSKFTFIKLQSRFGTKYGIKKKKKNGKVLKDRFGEEICEEDNDGNYIYEENYLSQYRFFKRDVLDKAIEELNSEKSPFLVKLIEHRERGMKRTPIEFIQFQVTRKKNNQFNNLIKYSSLGYYAACRIHFFNIVNNKEPISNLQEYGSKLDESFDKGEFTKPIMNINSLLELENTVDNNHNCIITIKDILSQDKIELAHLKFDEKLLVVFDTSTPRNKFGLHTRLGDDAIECLESILRDYSHIINVEINEFPLIYKYLPFDFKDEIANDFVTINQDNYDEYKSQIDTTIDLKEKKNFKKFKNRELKNEFFTTFFNTNIEKE